MTIDTKIIFFGYVTLILWLIIWAYLFMEFNVYTTSNIDRAVYAFEPVSPNIFIHFLAMSLGVILPQERFKKYVSFEGEGGRKRGIF